MDKKGNKRVHKCPPIHPMYSAKLTGPEYHDGESVSKANVAWGEYLRRLQKVTPMQRRRAA